VSKPLQPPEEQELHNFTIKEDAGRAAACTFGDPLTEYGFHVGTTKPKVHCKVFEDNSGALEIATVHKVRPRTKHMNVQFHHFCHHINTGQMTVHPIDTDEQPADMLSKSLPLVKLVKHRQFIMGW